MNLYDVVILSVIVILAVCAVVFAFKHRKKGCCGMCELCRGCEKKDK